MDIADMGMVQLIAVVLLGLSTAVISQWVDDDRRETAKVSLTNKR